MSETTYTAEIITSDDFNGAEIDMSWTTEHQVVPASDDARKDLEEIRNFEI